MRRQHHAIAVILVTLCAARASAQLAPVDQPAVCFECHSDIEEQMAAKRVHTAFKGGECSDCHNPHASKHATLLADDNRALCLSCHQDVAEALILPSAHRPAASGDCVSCHHPHASPHRNQLNKSLPGLCQDCHQQATGWTSQPVVHRPVATGDCTTCHLTHGAENTSLLSRSIPSLCFGCHEQSQALTKAHRFDVGQADCTACHDPHAAKRKGLLRANQHAPFASGRCNTCHGSVQGGSYALKEDVKTLCLGCHKGIEAFESTAHHHNLDDEQSCANCHNAHASDGEFLLAASQEVLCMRCHFNDTGEKTKADYVTHDGLTCTECHLPHGSDDPKYLKTREVDLCARCHEAAHRVTHPVGEDVIDPRTGESVTCVSCHQMHGPDFADYLPLDPSSDLCIQCHRR